MWNRITETYVYYSYYIETSAQIFGGPMLLIGGAYLYYFLFK